MTGFATTSISVLPLGFNEQADERDEHGRFTPETGRDVVYDLVKDIALRATSGQYSLNSKYWRFWIRLSERRGGNQH